MTESIRKLGRYELLRQLATGGMGEIYLARTRGAGGFEKHLIIKTILPRLAEQNEFVEKFLDEGRIVVQLTHGNIVPVFDMGEEDGEYYIAMEYVPGLDLRAIIKRLSVRDEQLPVEIALYVACEICKGLGYAHRKTDEDGNHLGIVHRDVSPSNVLVSREGEIKIIDFGIARAASRVAETATGQIQGKCCYMSPEQARGERLDARSDIFSTGVLLYEMLTLQRPFEGHSDLQTLELVKNCEADPPGVLRPEIPEEVDEIVGRAMEADPEDRYQSIDDMFVDLQQQMYGLGTTVTSQTLVEQLEEVFEDDEADDAEEQDRRPPADLDEALELELAKLDDSPGSTPSDSGSPLELAETAADSPGTQTLASTPDERPARPRPDNTGSAGSPEPTPAPESTPGAHTETETDPEATGPDHAELTPDERPADQKIDRDAQTDPDEPVDEAPAPRHLARTGGTALTAALIIAALATAYILQSDPAGPATLQLASDPAGAEIRLDGESTGETTPATIETEPGRYLLELHHDGYRPYSIDAVELEADETLSLDERDLQLRPEQDQRRRFTVTTDPEDATLLADNEQLGSTPAEVMLEESEVVNLSARAPNCSPVYYTLSHSHDSSDVHLELDCEPTDDEQADHQLRAEQERIEATAVVTGRADPVRIETDPRGAEVVVDDEELGQAPLYAELAPGTEATIEARHPGYEPYRATTNPAELDDNEIELRLEQRARGCLNFRAVYPANNKIAINDEWLEDRHMRLENHSLPAGRNTITVHHPESDKRETFEVDIDAGDDCKVLTVWERD